MDWLPVDAAMPALIADWRHRRSAASLQASLSATATVSATLGPEERRGSRLEYPEVLIQAAVISLGDQTAEGRLVEAVAIPWFEIIGQLERDPEFLYKVNWRTLEEIIAGAYTRAGWPEVVLTPRSGDGGRDVIATKPGVCSIRLVDQVKAYRKGRVVTADDVRSLLGVLAEDRNVSKGLITTTSHFAPGIEKSSGLSAFIPYRLELKNGNELRHWLLTLSEKPNRERNGAV
jgi:restriction system protein